MKRKQQNNNQEDIQKRILDFFKSNPLIGFALKDIIDALGIRDKGRQAMAKEAMADLISKGKIEKYNRLKYTISKSEIKTKTGIISIVKNGSGYVKLDGQKENEQDISIDLRDIIDNHVLDGDKLEIYIYDKNIRTGRKYGRIIRIAKRRSTPIIGVLRVKDSYGTILTEALRTTNMVFIPKESLKGAKDGEKVAVRIVDWPKNSKNPQGKVIDILGKPGENDTEMHAILTEFDLPCSYPQRLEKIADRLDSGITPEEIAKRRDMRGVCTFTIDPATAKDFDDALSVQKLANGNWEVGIHIADVTHYVRKGDDIDGEGYERATSVYLVDRTVPMLPEKLSNFLCSLRPDEDKLCFSTIFEMDENAHVESTWIGRTVIRSIRRFNYDQAQEIIEGKSSELHDELTALDRLAKKLREDRFKNGAINFERDEPQFELDEKGVPVRVYFRQMKDSNQLIEEFMLLANRSVAEYIGKMKKSFVYRIHDAPDREKYDKFLNFVQRFGYKVQSHSIKKTGEELSNLLDKVKGKPEESLLGILAIRTMAKAVYSTHNIGHYGLAFKYYTHFTSPIRRYPDMMVHRLLDRYLSGGSSVVESEFEEYCKHCSEMEAKAAEAERASIKYKMVEFLKDKVGSVYQGMVTSITEWGIYVELDENRIEGMISLRSLARHGYFYDKDNMSIEEPLHSKRFTLGAKVRIKIEKADLEHRQLDFQLIGFYDNNGKFYQDPEI